VLRVHRRGLHGRVTEECRVEIPRGFQHRRRLHIRGIGEIPVGHAGLAQFLVGEPRDRFHAARQVRPELLGVARSRKAAGDTDDRDIEFSTH